MPDAVPVVGGEILRTQCKALAVDEKWELFRIIGTKRSIGFDALLKRIGTGKVDLAHHIEDLLRVELIEEAGHVKRGSTHEVTMYALSERGRRLRECSK